MPRPPSGGRSATSTSSRSDARAGTRGSRSRSGAGIATAGLTYFRNDFRNLIDYDFSRGYVNIGRARTRGVEAAGEIKPGERFSLRLAYTRLEAIDLDSGPSCRGARRIFYRPSADWLPGARWTLHLSVVHTGTREDRDYSGFDAWNVTLPAYTLVNASASFRIVKGWQAFVRLDNLLNTRYEPVFGYGAPGFCVYAGIKIN